MHRTAEPIDIVIHGRHAGVSDRFKDFVREKLGHVAKFAVPIQRIDVEVSHEANPRQQDRAFEVELTCSGSPFIRVEAHAHDKYAALEAAYDKLEERLRRLHDRARSVRHDRPVPLPARAPSIRASHSYAIADDPSIVFESGPLVVRTKHIATARMSVEEAVDQMEMVGHDFFLFENEATGLPSVIYRRRGYDFGLVQLGSHEAALSA